MSEHELWNELGNLYFMSGAYHQAIHAYRRSIQIDAEFGRPYSNLALTYAQQGKYEDAVRLFQRGIELLEDDKEKAISWMRLGNVFRQLKDYREAVIAYQHADELDPDNPENRDDPGHGLYTPASPSQIELDLDKEIRLQGPVAPQGQPSPPDPDSLLDLVADEEQAEPSFAIADDSMNLVIDEESESDPSGVELENLQNWTAVMPAPDSNPESPVEELIEAEDSPDANQPDPELDSYYQPIDPSDPVYPVENKKTTASALADASSIHVQIDTALDELPPTKFPIFRSGEATPAPIFSDAKPDSSQDEQTDKDLEKAEREIQRLRRVVQINPHNGLAWDTLGNIYKSINLFKEAIFSYQQAISTNESKAYYHYHLALAYAATGHDEDALGTLQKVIELDPNHSLAHATLGGYFRKMGLEELAQKHISKAMKTIFDSENEYNRACFEAICGNAEQAIDLLRIALGKKQTTVDWVLRDPDLDFVRRDQRFKQLISDFTR